MLAFGLWDLGIGSPKLESFSLGGLASLKSTLGHGVEMDLNFQPADKPLSHYAREAMAAGRITV